jgi:hypothetical protein
MKREKMDFCIIIIQNHCCPVKLLYVCGIIPLSMNSLIFRPYRALKVIDVLVSTNILFLTELKGLDEVTM